MRLARLSLLLVGLLALAPATAAAAQPPGKRCAAPGTATVAKSLQARVYERGGDEHELIGCNRRSGKRTPLTTWFNCECSTADEPAPKIWLAGGHVAFNRYFCPPDASPCRGDLRVFDLRTGRMRYSAPTDALIDLVIKPNGSVAYLRGAQLFRIDSRGTALIDEGAGIDGGSLAVNRTRVYWLRDNEPRTASLR